MSFGVVPASSSLRGPNGYFTGLQPSTGEPDADERQSLLQHPSRVSSKASAAFETAPGGPAGSSISSSQQQQRLPFSSLHSHARGTAGSSAAATAAARSDAVPGLSPADVAGISGAAAGRAPNFESLDYELVENTVYRTDTAARTHFDHIFKSGAKWTMCFALGVITAAAAFAVNLGVENISGFKFWATLTLLERGQPVASFLVYALVNCVLIGVSVYVTVNYAPAAAGSGIAEVKSYLNGIDVPGIFLWNTLLVKLLGSVGAVAGGLAVGKEGPFVHAGACLGALISQGGSSSNHFPWFKRFWNDRDRADMVACGAAAGVAAAFRAPVGGVLFALEEMTSWFRNQLLWYAFFTTAVVSVAVRTLMRICSNDKTGSCGFFGAGGFPLYEITEGQENFEFLELLPMLLLGVIGGLLGSCFNHLNALLAGWRKQRLLKYGPRGRLWEGLAAALLTSTVSFLLPMMVACQPCPPDAGEDCPRTDNSHSGNFVSFNCYGARPAYNDLATIFFNTQDDAIRNLFSSQTKNEYGVSTLLTFVVMFFFLAVVSYGVAIPTGLFVPSILCGAAYGRLVGVFVADMRPGTHSIDEGTYALLGAASFLGGCMRMTVATCVMLLELTSNLALLPMMMLVTLVAKAVGDGTGVKPIYESLIDLKQLPYLEPHPHSLMCHITAVEAAGQPAVTFSRVERVGRILEVLRSTAHNGFAVISGSADCEQHIMGIVLRSQLVVLLRTRRCFQPTPFVSEVAGRVAFSYQQSDFVRPISEAQPGIGSLQLSEQEAAMFLDLGPYVNPSYYVVQEDTSLAKVYTLFRSLGLRHLAVIPRASSVVGVITRHDLLGSSLEATCLEQLTLGAGAAGLASALRGTVQEAVDAYQHQHQQEAISLQPLSAVLHSPPSSAATAPPGAASRAAAAGAGAGSSPAASSALRNATGQGPGSSKGAAISRLAGSRGEGSGLTPRSAAAAAAAAAGAGAAPVEIAADSSSVGSLGGTPLFRGVSSMTHRTGSGNMGTRLAASHHSSNSSGWDDFEPIGGTSSAAL
uniref:Chloride channel protein n=1 Tax=Tetradesmus obliquus TaxID=3088 RepID=A0A383VWF9_TETOB|eukprot:jgi/Sobl393_1/12209/SZX69142.1